MEMDGHHAGCGERPDRFGQEIVIRVDDVRDGDFRRYWLAVHRDSQCQSFLSFHAKAIVRRNLRNRKVDLHTPAHARNALPNPKLVGRE